VIAYQKLGHPYLLSSIYRRLPKYLCAVSLESAVTIFASWVKPLSSFSVLTLLVGSLNTWKLIADITCNPFDGTLRPYSTNQPISPAKPSLWRIFTGNRKYCNRGVCSYIDYSITVIQHTICCTRGSSRASYIHLVFILNHVLLQIKRLNRLSGRSLQTAVKQQLKFLLSPSAQKLYNYFGERGRSHLEVLCWHLWWQVSDHHFTFFQAE